MKRKVVFLFLITCLRFLFAHDYKYLDNVKTQYKLVKIPEKNIYIGITEVTQSLYQEILGVNPSWYCYNNPNLMKLKYELEDLKNLLEMIQDSFPSKALVGMMPFIFVISLVKNVILLQYIQ